MKQNSNLQVPCPICQRQVQWNDKFPFRPFCSERCQLIDIGAWSSESYRIDGQHDESGDDVF
ncbi:MAG: DNA gyrase inhibitor YacG [Pseudomonadota bacterium]